MKTILATIAALGLLVSVASGCPLHQSMASAQVDTTKTASVQESDVTKATDTQTVIKKQVPPPKTE